MEQDATTMIWIPDAKDAWLLARVISNDEQEGTVTTLCNGTTSTFKESETFPYDASHLEYPNDLCKMNNFHDASLLHALRERYQSDVIYTNIADVLVLINPYKLMRNLYEDPLRYLVPSGVDATTAKPSDPHVYKVHITLHFFLTLQ